MAGIVFLIETHREHSPSPMPAKKKQLRRKKTLNDPTRKQLQRRKKKTRKQLLLRNKYKDMQKLPSRWTAHKVAVAILWRHRHLKKLKLKKKAKEEDLQNVVLPYGGDGSGSRVLFEGYLQHKFRPRKPSRFFFEHQARNSAEASKNTTSGPSSEDHY